jgi:methylmalonyl-CoA mutase
MIGCGVILPLDYECLRKTGVVGVYAPGSNIVECAAGGLRLLGHNMPPERESDKDV